jgi:hypothetical protein
VDFCFTITQPGLIQTHAIRLPYRTPAPGAPPTSAYARVTHLAQFTTLPSSSSASPPAYSLQGSFGPAIGALVSEYNTAPPGDELGRAQAELAQVRDIMVQNVEQILSRGERIELLVDKTDAMAGQATAFRRGARAARRQMWWKNTRVLALSGVAALVSFDLCGRESTRRLTARDRSCCGSLPPSSAARG